MLILNDPTRDQYTRLDLILIKALALKNSMMSGNFPVWLDRSDRVAFEVKSFTSNSQAAIERKKYQVEKAMQNSKTTPPFGVAYYAVPKTKDGGPMPTKREWVEEQAEKTGSKVVGRPE